MNIIKIPAKQQIGNKATKEEVKKLRVAAYCRVSTDNEEQAGSYETQVSHYREFISANPEWILVDVYADEGIMVISTSPFASIVFMFSFSKKTGILISFSIRI